MPPFYSCRYIERGLSLSYNDLRACAVVQGDRGRPILARVARDDVIDVAQLIEKKAEIRAANQTLERYSDCEGCPHLELADWARDGGQLDWIGITNYVYCNVDCTYCWLTFADYSPMKDTKNRPAQAYSARDVIDQLFAKDLIVRGVIVDWGGGGEPTLSKEFDGIFDLFAAHGALQWLHTNAVKVPANLERWDITEDTMRILCSLDSATSPTYLRVKQRDRFDRVVSNLKRYRAAGARIVLKYLVIEDNADITEAQKFIDLACEIGATTIITDVDHRFPAPSGKVLAMLRALKSAAKEAKLACRFDAVGSNSVSRGLYAELNG